MVPCTWRGAGVDGDEAVGHGAVAVVVDVDADRRADAGATTSRTTAATTAGREAPFVSHRQTTAAPASAAAVTQRSAYSGSSR